MDKKYFDKDRGDKQCPFTIRLNGDDPGVYMCVLVDDHRNDLGEIPHGLVFYRDDRREEKK